MPYCADTNILLRWLEPGTPMCEQAQQAVNALRAEGEIVYITAQNLVEFWNGATRPANVNGLGLTPEAVEAEARQLEALFPILPDTPEILPQWRDLVVRHRVIGAQVHDARIAAALRVHGIPHLLTFNVRHFAHYEGVTAVHPADVVAAPPDGA